MSKTEADLWTGEEALQKELAIRPQDAPPLEALEEVNVGVIKPHSQKYGPRLRRLMAEHGLSREAQQLVILIAINVADKSGVQDVAKRLHITKHSKQAVDFIRSACVENTHNVRSSTIPFAYVPTANPSLSAMTWKKGVKRSCRKYEFFVRNLWCAQLRVDEGVQEENEIYERWLWDRFANGKKSGSERLKFPEGYYQGKAMEQYALVNEDGSIWEPQNTRYSRADIERYLNS